MKKLTWVILGIVLVVIIIGVLTWYEDHRIHESPPVIVGGCGGVYYIYWQQCCDNWASDNNISHIQCLGNWTVENNVCTWKCENSGGKLCATDKDCPMTACPDCIVNGNPCPCPHYKCIDGRCTLVTS